MPVVAVASRTAERAGERATQLQSVAATYAELPAGADIVVVSTPPQLHAADTLHLLAAGAAVVLEKPLCTTLADADTLVAAAATHGQRVLYAENLAYAPALTTMLHMAADIGPIDHLQIRTLQALPTWGEFTSDDWGGGALFDLGVHPLAIAVLAAAAAGAGPVTSVSCTLRGGEGHNSDEHAEVALTFRNGLVGHVISSWNHGPGQTWDAELSGPTGVLRIDFWPQPTLEYNGEPVTLPAPLTAPLPAPLPAPLTEPLPAPLTAPPPQSASPLAFIQQLGYVGQLCAFAADIAAGTTPFMDVAFGRLILDIVCAAYQSAGHDGTPEPVPFVGDRTKTPLQLWHGT